MIHPDEPFTVDEIRGMTSAQLGELLGEVFGLRPGQRLIVERSVAGDVEMTLEMVASRTWPATNCREFKTSLIRSGPLLRVPAGATQGRPFKSWEDEEQHP